MATSREEQKKKTTKKAIVTPSGGKVEEQKKMGAPTKPKKEKLKAYSVYLKEDQATEVADIFVGDTPNGFLKDLVNVVLEDGTKLVQVAEIVYGVGSREAKYAQFVAEEKKSKK